MRVSSRQSSASRLAVGRAILLGRALLCLLLTAYCPLARADRPDLVVVISVDQLRFDYIERFAPWYSERGLNRFLKSGAIFTNTRYRHGVTFTGPGHAAIGTGLLPAENGIVGNTWFERDAPFDAKRWRWFFDDSEPFTREPKPAPLAPGEKSWIETGGGSPRYCAYDDRVNPTAGKTTGMSPVSLAGDSFGDRVKNRYPNARVFAVALKDRAAILMAGRLADSAYWFDYRLPGFISSTYYRFDPALFAFNDSVKGYLPASQKWKLSPYIPPADLERVTFDPPAAWPLKNTRYGGTFDHKADDMRSLTYSPYGHDLVLDFAMRMITTEKIGANHEAPDVLFVGLSSTDYLGHYYGPDSKEAVDNMLRMDRSLEAFFDALDRRFGKRYVVALTADHGVQANPEIVKLRDPKADVGRIELRNPSVDARTIADLPQSRIDIEREVAKKLRIPFSVNASLNDAIVRFFEEPSLYVNWRRVDELKLDRERVKNALRDVVRAMKTNGVDTVWTNTEMLAANANASEAETLMRASFRSDRTGDIIIALRPGWIWTWGSNSTTHGQPVENDRHVPLLFYGTGIKPGRYDDDASPIDLSATLGALLDVRAGGREAHVLPCVP